MSGPGEVGTTVHFVHASDSHARSGRDRSSAELARLTRFVERVRRWRDDGVPIDFVVHTGDLVDGADAAGASPRDTADALAVLDGLPVRWFLLNGNHDRRDFLGGGPRDPDADGSGSLGDVPEADDAGVATRRVGGVRLIFVDADPGGGGRPSVVGGISPAAVARVARCIDAHDARSAVFLHYPPLAPEAAWPGACAGGEALHAALAARTARLHGVFVGHSHRAIHHLRDGVLYATAPALARAFLLWPGQARFAVDEAGVAGVHYVTLEANGATRVQHHALDLGAPPSA